MKNHSNVRQSGSPKLQLSCPPDQCHLMAIPYSINVKLILSVLYKLWPPSHHSYTGSSIITRKCVLRDPPFLNSCKLIHQLWPHKIRSICFWRSVYQLETTWCLGVLWEWHSWHKLCSQYLYCMCVTIYWTHHIQKYKYKSTDHSSSSTSHQQRKMFMSAHSDADMYCTLKCFLYH